MGREVMRVPLDFDCPIGETWSGRLNPHRVKDCDACRGYGRDDSYRALEDVARLVLLAGADSANHGGPSHPYFSSTPLRGKAAPKLHEVTAGLAGRAPRFPLGHDAIDSWKATKAILRAAKLPLSWGTCTACKGKGYPPDQAAEARRAERWQMPDPPKGDGWQLWQTVSEGGPVSPVSATPEELARWMSTPGNDTSITRGRSYDQWLQFITGPGWAPSMMSTGNEPPVSGVEFATRGAP